MKAIIIRLPETESTNAFAINMLAQKRPEEGCVIITDHQTRGKGLDINSWESEKGKNLTFSIILYPEITADQQFVLNKAISLGIFDFLKAVLSEQAISIKWPNDIYVGDKKACGILIQNSVMANRLDYVVAGIGLNVNQTLFLSGAPNPVSMKIAAEQEYDLAIILDLLLKSIFNRYYQVNEILTNKIETDYQNALYRLNEWHNYEVKGTRIKAKITGTNLYGQLMLETEAGPLLVCDLKEVKFHI